MKKWRKSMKNDQKNDKNMTKFHEPEKNENC